LASFSFLVVTQDSGRPVSERERQRFGAIGRPEAALTGFFCGLDLDASCFLPLLLAVASPRVGERFIPKDARHFFEMES
jgi:hypothetical protein